MPLSSLMITAAPLMPAICSWRSKSSLMAETFKGSVSDYIARLHEARAGAVQKYMPREKLNKIPTRERLEKDTANWGTGGFIGKMAAEYGVAISLDY